MWTSCLMHQSLINYPFWDWGVLKQIWQTATTPPPLLRNVLRSEFLNNIGREQNKWAYIYTSAASLFFHHIYKNRSWLSLVPPLVLLSISHLCRSPYPHPSALAHRLCVCVYGLWWERLIWKINCNLLYCGYCQRSPLDRIPKVGDKDGE